nr:hypothetical protein Iba_chr02dCG8680 [Ipomoea batatas]
MRGQTAGVTYDELFIAFSKSDVASPKSQPAKAHHHLRPPLAGTASRPLLVPVNRLQRTNGEDDSSPEIANEKKLERDSHN